MTISRLSAAVGDRRRRADRAHRAKAALSRGIVGARVALGVRDRRWTAAWHWRRYRGRAGSQSRATLRTWRWKIWSNSALSLASLAPGVATTAASAGESVSGSSASVAPLARNERRSISAVPPRSIEEIHTDLDAGANTLRRTSAYACRRYCLRKVVKRRAADPEELGGARDIVIGPAHRLADRLAVGDFARRAEVDRQHVVARNDPD